MRLVKINILFIFLLGFNAKAITLPTLKSLNFAGGESLTRYSVIASESKTGVNFTLLKMATHQAIYQKEAVQLFSFKAAVTQPTKLSFIQKIIKSNLKLSFRLKCNMNLVITYQ